MITLKNIEKQEEEMCSFTLPPQNHNEDDRELGESSTLMDKSNGSGIGSPLKASSPLQHSYTEDGKGDNLSIRSGHSLLSPIRCGMKCYPKRTHGSILLATPPSSPSNSNANSPSKVTADSFLGNFEKSSPQQKSPRPCSLQQELMISEKISGMEENEAKKFLNKVLIDNMALRQELRTKEKRITAYKGQMLAILDWKAKQEADGESSDAPIPATAKSGNSLKIASMSKSKAKKKKASTTEDSEESESFSSEKDNMIGLKTFRSSQEFTIVEEVNGVKRSLSYIQELASSIELDQDLLKDRLSKGYQVTNQFLVGAVGGWTSALFVKKFGKLALSATCGGLVLLVYTARKGFINVNYESIYQEISKYCGDPMDSAIMDRTGNESGNDGTLDISLQSNNSTLTCGGGESDNGLGNKSHLSITGSGSGGELCAYDRLLQAKQWIMDHSYTVAGFGLAFVYNLRT